MQEQEIHLRDYLQIVRKRMGVLILFMVITFLTVAVGTFTSTPMYSASVNVLIEKSDKNELMGPTAYGSYDPEFHETQVQLIKSFNVAKRIVDSLDLAGKYKNYFVQPNSAFQDLISTKKEELLQLLTNKLKALLPGALDNDPTRGMGNAPGISLADLTNKISEVDLMTIDIMDAIKVSPIRASRVVEISYMHSNPVITQMVANQIAKAYRDEVLEIRMNNSSYAIKWMTEKVLEERERLEESEKILQQYMEKANIVTLENKITVLPEKLRELGTRLSQALAKQNQLKVLFHKVDKIKELKEAETLSEITSSRYYQGLLTKVLEAEQTVDNLSKKYGPKHPKMIQAKEKLLTLNQEVMNEIFRQINSIKNRFELTKEEVKNLEKMIETTKKEAQKTNQNFIRYGILQRDVETNRTMYQALLASIKEKKISEEIRNINVWIIKAATTPESPTKPNKARNLLLGLVLGLFGGVVLAFFLDYLDNTVHSPDELEKRFGVPVLSVLDHLGYKKLSNFQTVNLLAADGGFSSYAEGIKAARTAILLSSAANPPKKIVVTSSTPQEGKSTTVVNLAKAFSMAGYKVVIIDADLRKPRLHKIFNLNNSKGLSSFLAGIEDEQIILPLEDDKNLFGIPAGPMPPNPSELLVSDRIKSLLSFLDEKFDFIFIDSAPLFSATETLFLAQLARPILVTRADVTTYNHLQESLKMLDGVDVKPLGLVLNGFDKKSSQYGYSSYKYHGYYTAEKDA